VFIKTSTYIVPTPSILTSEDIWAWLTLDNTNIKSQVTNLWRNIPNIWNVNYNTWALTNLTLNATWTIDNDSTDAQKLSVYQAIYNTYTWTILATDWVIQIILNQTTDEEKISITKTVVLNNTTTVATVISNSCDDSTKPADDLNKTYTVNPTNINQAYIQDSNECWYTCTNEYTWINCEIPPFLCWNTVSALWKTYTTITWPDWNCWTSQNMNHWNMLANWSTMPSEINVIEKWCYDNNSAICTTDGWFYTRSEAMWFDASCDTINCTQAENTTYSVCWALWVWWWLPTNEQLTTLINEWATWWLWNKLSWIVSSLPGRRGTNTTFFNRTFYASRWSSTEYGTTNSRNGGMAYDNAIATVGITTKANGLSVVCIRN